MYEQLLVHKNYLSLANTNCIMPYIAQFAINLKYNVLVKNQLKLDQYILNISNYKYTGSR